MNQSSRLSKNKREIVRRYHCLGCRPGPHVGVGCLGDQRSGAVGSDCALAYASGASAVPVVAGMALEPVQCVQQLRL